MRHSLLVAALLAALALAGCSKTEPPAQPLRSVRVMKIDGAAVSGGLTFPGEVRAQVRFTFVHSMDEAIERMLLPAPPLGFSDDLPLFDGSPRPADAAPRRDEQAAADRPR